jgi:hypothetical protein
MITENQLRALDFEYYENTEVWQFKEIAIYLDGQSYSVLLNDFELYGINDHRDLSKFIKLVYGE